MIQSSDIHEHLTSRFAGKVVCVIGATGFIGSHLVDALLASGCYVRAVSRTFPGLMSEAALLHPKLSVHRVDICDKQGLGEILSGVEVLIHLACGCIPQNSNDYPVSDVEINLIGSLNILDCSVTHKIKKFIFISSGGTVYGTPLFVPLTEDHPTEPTCSYGITKLAIEKYILLYKRLYGLNGIILRLANPYGERQRLDSAQGVVPAFLIRAIRRQPLVVWGDGTVVRDFLYITDVVQAIICSFLYDGNTSIFNIGSGSGLSLNQLISLIESVIGRKIDVTYMKPRPFDVPTNILAIDRAVRLLNWQPSVCANDGITKFYKYLVDI